MSRQRRSIWQQRKPEERFFILNTKQVLIKGKGVRFTAMMADKAQDKTVTLLPSDYQSINNVLNGTAREISFNPVPAGSPRLDIAVPSSANNGFIHGIGKDNIPVLVSSTLKNWHQAPAVDIPG